MRTLPSVSMSATANAAPDQLRPEPDLYRSSTFEAPKEPPPVHSGHYLTVFVA